jgi:outer membrane biosynthesis protein TonB
MIPRTLVPYGSRPPDAGAAATQRRRPTTLDERTLVPAMLPVVPLNGHSSIPASLPLESIAARVVVPRDLNQEAYGVREAISAPLQPTEMDERIAVPQGAAPPETTEAPIRPPEDLVDLDVFMTGEVNLLTTPKVEEKAKWSLITRFSSVAFHILVIAAILLQAKLFPPHVPTQQEVRTQLTFLPLPGSYESLKPEVRKVPTPPPVVKVDPRILREVAPPLPQPQPAPPPERSIKELPSAPIAKPDAAPPTPQPVTPAPKSETPRAPVKLETPDFPQPRHGLILPKSSSPGQNIQDSLREAQKMSGPQPIVGGGAIPGNSAPGSGGKGTVYGGLEMLTPTQGVDFNDYLMRVYVTVKRNWFAIMPASAELGDKGIVVLTFRIMRDGSVPPGQPDVLRPSGKEPLDRAAYSSIRASNPFEPLPPAFTGPYIELRYTYLYNIPIEYLNQQR